MRLIVAAMVAVLVVLGVGMLPPVFARSSLDAATRQAAQAGSEAFGNGSVSAADAAALRSIAAHPDVHVVSMGSVSKEPDTFEVTTNEHVHSFMDGISALSGWFLISSTQQSTAGL